MAQNKGRYLWPFSVVLHVPDSTSQILTVVSLDADTMVLPSGAKSHAKTLSLPFFRNVREHICNGRLRLSPAERGVGVGKTVTLTVLPTFCLRKGTKQRKVPVAFQRRLARARFHVPDLYSPVPGCRHDGLAVGRKIAR